MKNTQVHCDECGADITYTGNCDGFRVVLSSEAMQHEPGCNVVTDVYVTPQFPQPRHFCGEKCLVRWILAEYQQTIRSLSHPGDA